MTDKRPRLYEEDPAQREALVKGAIRTLPFKGVDFKDINTLLGDSKAFRAAVDTLLDRYTSEKGPSFDMIAALDARGFPFAGPLAYKMGIPWTMIRKVGKLPGEIVSVSYKTEYSEDTVACQKDAIPKGARVLVMDDLLATGGTAAAACDLVERCGGVVSEVACIVELAFLKGREKLSKHKVYSMIVY